MAPGVIYGRRGSGRATDGNVGLGPVETLGARDAPPSGLTSMNTSGQPDSLLPAGCVSKARAKQETLGFPENGFYNL